MKDVLETYVDEKYYLSDEQISKLTFNMDNQHKESDKIKILAHRTGYRRNTQVFDQDGLTETLDTGQGGGRGHYTLIARGNKSPKQVLVREATKKGYSVAEVGDSINFEHPNSKTRRGRVGKGVANTLTTSCNQGTLDDFRIRKLTPLECFRLQGFPDEAFRAAEKVNSNSQLYKQAGNSVTVNVIEAIAERF